MSYPSPNGWQVPKTPFPIPWDAGLVVAINNAWSEIKARWAKVGWSQIVIFSGVAKFKRVEIGGADFPQRRPKKSLLHAQTTPRV